MQTVLLVIYLMVVVALIGIVLVQRSEGGGLGIGGGSGFMSARGAANALTRTTAILATLFFVLALGMGILSRYETQPTDILDRIPGTTGSGNGVLDSLGGEATPPAAPNDIPGPASNNAVPTDSGSAPATETTPAAGGAAAPAAPAPTPGVPTGQ